MPTLCICPSCKSDLRGAEIPNCYKHFYAPDATHYLRLVGFTIRGNDYTSSFRCPDCGFEAPSVNNFETNPGE